MQPQIAQILTPSGQLQQVQLAQGHMMMPSQNHVVLQTNHSHNQSHNHVVVQSSSSASSTPTNTSVTATASVSSPNVSVQVSQLLNNLASKSNQIITVYKTDSTRVSGAS